MIIFIYQNGRDGLDGGRSAVWERGMSFAAGGGAVDPRDGRYVGVKHKVRHKKQRGIRKKLFTTTML